MVYVAAARRGADASGQRPCCKHALNADGGRRVAGTGRARAEVLGRVLRAHRPRRLAPLQHARRRGARAGAREVRARHAQPKTRDEWLAEFADADVCLTPIYSLDEALRDPHVIARGLVTEIDDVTYIGAGRPVRPAPALGADTDEILAALGLSAGERSDLYDRGVVR